MAYSVYVLVLRANLTSDTVGSSSPHKYIIARQELYYQAVSYILKPSILQLFPPKISIYVNYICICMSVYVHVCIPIVGLSKKFALDLSHQFKKY